VIGVIIVILGPDPAPGPKPTPTAAPTVSPGRLDSLLVDPAELNTIMGASAMKPGPVTHDMDSSAVTMSDPNCLGAINVVAAPVYQGSGFTAVSGQTARESADDFNHFVSANAVTFPSAAQAQAFLASSTENWKACSGRTVSKTTDKPYRWTVGDVTATDGQITTLNTQEDASGWACQHTLATTSNVVFDVEACGYRITDEADQVVDKMRAAATK